MTRPQAPLSSPAASPPSGGRQDRHWPSLSRSLDRRLRPQPPCLRLAEAATDASRLAQARGVDLYAHPAVILTEGAHVDLRRMLPWAKPDRHLSFAPDLRPSRAGTTSDRPMYNDVLGTRIAPPASRPHRHGRARAASVGDRGGQRDPRQGLTSLALPRPRVGLPREDHNARISLHRRSHARTLRGAERDLWRMGVAVRHAEHRLRYLRELLPADWQVDYLYPHRHPIPSPTASNALHEGAGSARPTSSATGHGPGSLRDLPRRRESAVSPIGAHLPPRAT